MLSESTISFVDHKKIALKELIFENKDQGSIREKLFVIKWQKDWASAAIFDKILLAQ